MNVDRGLVEIRGFKWPRRSVGSTRAYFLGEDAFGKWLGIKKGDAWWSEDRSRSGLYLESFVKLIPDSSFWSVCFSEFDPIVDVDIVMPVTWGHSTVEEIDLELDVRRYKDGRVQIEDEDEFNRVRSEWALPDDVATQAQNVCRTVYDLVLQGAEPFGSVGCSWLDRFLKSGPLGSFLR